MKPSGPAIVATVMTAVITFGRSSFGVRTVSMPRIGAFTSGEKNANAATTTIAAPQGIDDGEQEERQRHRDDRERGELQQVDLRREMLRHDGAERARRPRTRRRGSRATCASAS